MILLWVLLQLLELTPSKFKLVHANYHWVIRYSCAKPAQWRLHTRSKAPKKGWIGTSWSQQITQLVSFCLLWPEQRQRQVATASSKWFKHVVTTKKKTPQKKHFKIEHILFTTTTTTTFHNQTHKPTYQQKQLNRGTSFSQALESLDHHKNCRSLCICTHPAPRPC